MTDNLEGLRAALNRGTKRARLRLGLVACPRGHTLVEVFRGDDGAPLALCQVRHVQTRGHGSDGVWPWPLVIDAGALPTYCRCPNPDGLVKSDTMWLIPIEIVQSAVSANSRLIAHDSWRSRRVAR